MAQWQTAVRVSTVLRELRVDMNIGNVLGKTIWVTELLTYHGSFDIKSCQNNDLKNIISLKKSKLESRSGLLGGTIVMNDVEGSCIWRDRNPHNEIPSQLSAHKIDFGLDEISIRIEYHSSVILLSKLLQAKLIVVDGSDQIAVILDSLESQRPKVLANCELKWGEFFLFLSRSTTPHLIQGGRKVHDFIQQQIKSGSEALSSFFENQKVKENLNIPHEASDDDRLQRHWPPIFNLDQRWRGLRLGGESRLSGNQLTVVCFDGRDFKADNWAVFSVHLPDISFSTDVYCESNTESGKENCVIYQHFIFNVGRPFDNIINFHDDQKLGAFVIRVTKTRARRRPGAQADVKEWVVYAVPQIDQNNPEKTKGLG